MLEIVDGGANASCVGSYGSMNWSYASMCYTLQEVNVTTDRAGPVGEANDDYDCRTRDWYADGFRAPAKGAWTSVYQYVTLNRAENSDFSVALGIDATAPLIDRCAY